MTQDEVKKAVKLSKNIEDAKDCLHRLQNRYVGEGSISLNNELDMLVGRWMRDNLAVSIPAVEEYINKLQSELDAL